MSSQTTYFGQEQVKVMSQTYRSMYINLLLWLALFGRKNGRLYSNEIIHKSKKVAILHFSSLARLKEVFTLSGLCGMEFNNVETCHRHFGCGKVNVRRNGRKLLGSIVGESDRMWTVHMWNNDKVNMKNYFIKMEHTFITKKMADE